MVTGAAIFFIVFFYSGTFLNWPGVKGLYLTFATWYQTGSNGNGHEKPWPYWLELVMRYEWPVFIGLVLCLACQFFRNFVIRYLAIYGVGIFAAYSIIHYKTPWIIISIVWPLLFVFAAGAAAAKIPRKAFYHDRAGPDRVWFRASGQLSHPAGGGAHGPVRWGAYLREAVKITIAATCTSSVCGEMGRAAFRVGARFRSPRRRAGFSPRKIVQTERGNDARDPKSAVGHFSPHVVWNGDLVELLPLQRPTASPMSMCRPTTISIG